MTLTGVNGSIFLILLVSFLSTVHCSNSTEESSYSCFLNDQCLDKLNASYFHRDNVTYCCKAGDVLKMSITGPKFRFESSSYISGRIHKRDGSDAPGDATDENPNNVTQINCSCQEISSDYLKKIFLQEKEKFIKMVEKIVNPFLDWFR